MCGLGPATQPCDSFGALDDLLSSPQQVYPKGVVQDIASRAETAPSLGPLTGRWWRWRSGTRGAHDSPAEDGHQPAPTGHRCGLDEREGVDGRPLRSAVPLGGAPVVVFDVGCGEVQGEGVHVRLLASGSR